jgi:hypothetical protein
MTSTSPSHPLENRHWADQVPEIWVTVDISARTTLALSRSLLLSNAFGRGFHFHGNLPVSRVSRFYPRIFLLRNAGRWNFASCLCC